MIDMTSHQAIIDPDVAAIRPTKSLKPFAQTRGVTESFCIIRTRHPNRYLQQTIGLLRARRERPNRRAAEQ
jgi:hypothetical protein